MTFWIALSRVLPSGKVETHAAAASGSVLAHWETADNAAWFWPSPAGKRETKLAASCGEFCTRPEAMPARIELRP